MASLCECSECVDFQSDADVVISPSTRLDSLQYIQLRIRCILLSTLTIKYTFILTIQHKYAFTAFYGLKPIKCNRDFPPKDRRGKTTLSCILLIETIVIVIEGVTYKALLGFFFIHKRHIQGVYSRLKKGNKKINSPRSKRNSQINRRMGQYYVILILLVLTPWSSPHIHIFHLTSVFIFTMNKRSNSRNEVKETKKNNKIEKEEKKSQKSK